MCAGVLGGLHGDSGITVNRIQIAIIPSVQTTHISQRCTEMHIRTELMDGYMCPFQKRKSIYNVSVTYSYHFPQTGSLEILDITTIKHFFGVKKVSSD